MSEVAKLMKETRRLAQMTQAEVAAAMETDSTTISRWENGRRMPSAENLMAYVKACGFRLIPGRNL